MLTASEHYSIIVILATLQEDYIFHQLVHNSISENNRVMPFQD